MRANAPNMLWTKKAGFMYSQANFKGWPHQQA